MTHPDCRHGGLLGHTERERKSSKHSMLYSLCTMAAGMEGKGYIAVPACSRAWRTLWAHREGKEKLKTFFAVFSVYHGCRHGGLFGHHGRESRNTEPPKESRGSYTCMHAWTPVQPLRSADAGTGMQRDAPNVSGHAHACTCMHAWTFVQPLRSADA
eukprot:1145365-Pelagomonas_calceolata.AAC.5